MGVGVPAADDDGTQSEPGGDGGGLPRLVRLRPGPVQQHVTAFFHRLRQRVLELPDLVPPHGQAGEVLPLDEQPGPQLGAQPRQRLERGRQDSQAEAGQAPEALADFCRRISHGSRFPGAREKVKDRFRRGGEPPAPPAPTAYKFNPANKLPDSGGAFRLTGCNVSRRFVHGPAPPPFTSLPEIRCRAESDSPATWTW